MLNDGTRISAPGFGADRDISALNGWSSSLDTITQPDCLLPVQFFERTATWPVEGEVLLLIAVLQDAINVYARTVNRNTPRHREDFDDVDAWFHARNQRGLFAFETICEILGIETSKLRRWLQEMRTGRDLAEAPTSVAGRRLDPLRRRRQLLVSRPRAASPRGYRRRASDETSARPAAYPAGQLSRYA